MRLIDADATIKEIKARNPDDVSYEDAWAITCIEHAPTIEPERTGKWIYHPEWQADGECGYECDQCGKGSDENYNYCPRCGAWMRMES